MTKRFVQCIYCSNRFTTKVTIGEETQCPHTSGGCGRRFKVTKEAVLA